MKPKFTLLIAVYNTETFLDECLQSLLRQTLTDWQAICIDDASTDGSSAILERYRQQDPRFLVLHTPSNSGQAVARNLGLQQATGSFTLMLDADDYLAPDALSTLWACHEEHPEADALLFNLTKLWEDQSLTPWTWPDHRRLLDGKTACLLSIDWQIHGCYALRTNLHQRYPYDTTFRVYSDDTTVRLHFLHCRKVALTEAVYYYRQHGASSTHRFSLHRLDFIDANRLLSRQLEREGLEKEALCVCENMIWKIYIGVLRELYAQRHLLSPSDRQEVRRRLTQSLKAMHPERLSWRLKGHPSYFFFPSYPLLSLWQRLLLTARSWMKGKRIPDVQ